MLVHVIADYGHGDLAFASASVISVVFSFSRAKNGALSNKKRNALSAVTKFGAD